METDLDIGHYERFLDVNLPGEANITTGKVYLSVIKKEREGKFLGSCVQIIPHVTDEIKRRIRNISERDDNDVALVEVGGTVGDIEGQPFLEALRQLKNEENYENVMFIHVTYVPYLKSAGELKTKPTQHSTKELRSMGINPDMIICRSEIPIDVNTKNKIAHFCDVEPNAVINVPDVSSIYEVPLILNKQNVGEYIINRLNLKPRSPFDMSRWEKIVKMMKVKKPSVTVGIVGKYVELEDSYISIREALRHAAAKVGVNVNIEWISADKDLKKENFENLDSILVPGGFGSRGVEGKLKVIRHAMNNKVPIFGICLGMQCMVIEFARQHGLKNANSTEFDKNTPYPVIDLMEEQKKIRKMGGTMRLGAYPCKIKKGTISYDAYKKDLVYERHRHRYEVNNEYRDILEEEGLVIAGVSPDNFLVEIIELEDHPWFLGCQFHPEFKSRPNRPHPLFVSFIEASLNNKKLRDRDKK